ncbi:ImmA/IrrE family metallo-endopeptidase [Niveispirillum lacus]|nr:ImmA/IrrE family metallo-endopeptidase [Niveispirillum lacus]
MTQKDQVNPSDVIASHQRSVPVDPFKIAKDLGIAVFFDYGMDKNIAGKIKRVKSKEIIDGFQIFINAKDAPSRQRFTLAHEIAHYVLHRDLIGDEVVDSALYRSPLGDQLETQANRLAAEILLPAQAVRAQVSVATSLGALAEYFKVSEAALRIRLQEIGL